MNRNVLFAASDTDSVDLSTSVLESSSERVAAIDRDFRFVVFNTAFSDDLLCLYERSPHLGQRIDEAIAEPDRQALLQHCEAALAGNALVVDQQLGSGDQRRWYELKFAPVMGNAGKVITAVIVARDITEWRIAKDRLAALLELTPGAVLVLDGDDRIRGANAKAAEVFGRPRDILEGLPFGRLVADGSPRVHSINRPHARLEAPEQRRFEMVGLRADGSTFPLEMAVTAMRSGEGSLVVVAA